MNQLTPLTDKLRQKHEYREALVSDLEKLRPLLKACGMRLSCLEDEGAARKMDQMDACVGVLVMKHREGGQ